MDDFLLLQGVEGSGKTSQMINLLTYLHQHKRRNVLFITTEPYKLRKLVRDKLPDSGATIMKWTPDFFEDLPDIGTQYEAILIDDVPMGDFAMRVLLQFVWETEIPLCVSVTPNKFPSTPLHDDRESIVAPDGVYQFIVHLQQVEDGFVLMRGEDVFLPNPARLH